MNPTGSTRITELLPEKIAKSCIGAGWTTVDHLRAVTDAEILRIPYLGRRALRKIRDLVGEYDPDARTLEQELAKRVLCAMRDSLSGNDDLWTLIDQWVAEEIKATEETNEAQIWLTGYSEPRVCISIFGHDNLLVVPFSAPSINLPTAPTDTFEISEAETQIKRLRKLAADFNEMASRGERDLARITGKNDK